MAPELVADGADRSLRPTGGAASIRARMGATQPDSWWRERGADELRALLYEWDPVGVSEEPDWPRDEYDDLLEPLRERLAAGASAGELAVFLERHVREHIGLDPDADREERFADRLVGWWSARRAD